MDALETFKVDGLTVELHYDDTGGEYANPREMDQLGTMVCWHPDYILGDEQMRGGGRGAVKTIFETGTGRTDFDSMRQVERYLRLARGAIITIPLYLYDHSGITMSAGAPNPFDNPRIRTDEYGTGIGWDTSMVGFIYTTAARVAELCGDPVRPFDKTYTPKDWTGTPEAWLADQLNGEVREYAAYLEGRIYGFVVKDEHGETVDSCWGYLADTTAKDGDDLTYIREEARSAAETAAQERLERRAKTAAGWAAAHARHGEGVTA